MGWDVRGSCRYYSGSTRVDGKPRRIYRGAGAAAEAHAREDARRRQFRAEERFARRVGEARLVVADAAIDELGTIAELLAGAALLIPGYHEHRGQWRARS